jgi:prefoldin subunit 5
MNEQQNHLSQLIEQRVTLSQQLEGIQAQTTRTRDLMLKTQGAIEYLEATGVTLPEPEVTEETEVSETEVVEEG